MAESAKVRAWRRESARLQLERFRRLPVTEKFLLIEHMSETVKFLTERARNRFVASRRLSTPTPQRTTES